MKTKTIPSSQCPEYLWQELAQVATGALTLQVTRDGAVMAMVVPPAASTTDFAEPPTPPPSASPRAFWDADTTALLQRTAHFRLGQMPTRAERNER